MRSFSNLWYWISLAVLWSTLSHFIIGVPFDMIQRAERYGGQAEQDLEDVTRIYVNRILFVSRQSGHWIVGIGFTVLTMLAVLGFGYLMGLPDYEFEFAQAVFLLAFPTALVMSLSYRTARKIDRVAPEGAALRKMLLRQRLLTQGVGAVAIFITAMYGMAQNMLVLNYN